MNLKLLFSSLLTLLVFSLSAQQLDSSPRFPGCESINNIKDRDKCAYQQLVSYINSAHYPNWARENRWMGITKVSFVINEDGHVSQVELLESSGYNILDTAAVSHVKKMPNWIPAYYEGEPVKIQYVVPIDWSIHIGLPGGKDQSAETFAIDSSLLKGPDPEKVTNDTRRGNRNRWDEVDDQ